MKLYIPDIGDKITLAADWEFKLYVESRNKSLLNKFDYEFKYTYGQDIDYHTVTLPKGITLEVDRIYIRKGAHMADYSSVTFKVVSTEFKNFNKARFWAKLADCNNIEFESQIGAERLEKVKLESERYFYQDTGNYINLTNSDFKLLNELVPNNSYFKVKGSLIFINGVKTDLPDKLSWIFGSETPDIAVRDINPKSNIKEVVLTVSVTRQYLKTTLANQSRTPIHGSFMSIISEPEYLYHVTYKNTYTLKHNNDLIGEYGTAATMLKHAKNYLENFRKDSAYKTITNIKDLFA